jgi:hypothetical protein
MFALLGVFYVFVATCIYTQCVKKKQVPLKIYIDVELEEVERDDNTDDEWCDYMEEDYIDQDDYNDEAYDYFHKYNDNVYNNVENLLLNMTSIDDDKHEIVLHDIYEHLQDNFINETEYYTEYNQPDITWKFEYKDCGLTVYDIESELTDFVDENFLTQNIIIYFNGERIMGSIDEKTKKTQ